MKINKILILFIIFNFSTFVIAKVQVKIYISEAKKTINATESIFLAQLAKDFTNLIDKESGKILDDKKRNKYFEEFMDSLKKKLSNINKLKFEKGILVIAFDWKESENEILFKASVFKFKFQNLEQKFSSKNNLEKSMNESSFESSFFDKMLYNQKLKSFIDISRKKSKERRSVSPDERDESQ